MAPSIVSNLLDYDPNPFSPSGIPIPGSLRFAIAEAHDYYDTNGVPDTITFNVDPNNGQTNFGLPQTINLNYGQLNIDRPVVIDAPKTHDPTKAYDYVTIQWNDSPYPSGNPLFGSDWSVLSIALSGSLSASAGVDLGGLRITGGKAPQGAGIYDNGSANLTIHQCEIIDNHAVGKLFTPIAATAGAGIFVATPPKFGPQGGILTVAISGSTIENNRTDTNDDTSDPQSDLGGGMYLGTNVSLSMSGSIIKGNFAENAGGGIHFGGGMAVLPNAPGVFEGKIVVNSSIFAKNKVSANGFGPDTYAADIAPGSFATGTKNLHGITDSGNFGIPLATIITTPTVTLGGTLAAPLDPLLKVLAFNGGLTETHAIDHLSPAHNTGANTIPVMYEQRGPGEYDGRDVGLLRVDKVSNLPDIGAYELQPAKVVTVNSFAETEHQGVTYITMSHSRVNSIWVTFNQPVASVSDPPAAFSLRQYYDGIQFVDLTVDTTASMATNKMMARLTFSGARTEASDDYLYPSLIDGKYQLTVVADELLVDVFQLDGNCDGLPGDNYSTSKTDVASPNFLYRLFGDVVGVDMAVANSDFNAFRTAFGGSGNIAQFDFNGDGACSGVDFNAFVARFGNSFP